MCGKWYSYVHVYAYLYHATSREWRVVLHSFTHHAPIFVSDPPPEYKLAHSIMDHTTASDGFEIN